MLQHTVHALQSELDNLRADNIKLYEKIKFLQSYPGRVSVHLSVCLSILGLGSHGQTEPRQKLHISNVHPASKLALIGVGKGQCSVQRGAGIQPPCQGVWNCAEGVSDIFKARSPNFLPNKACTPPP